MKTNVSSDVTIEGRVAIRLTEAEAKALYSITVYGHRNFLNWFYERLGKHYLEPNAQGLISLFDKIRQELPPHLEQIRKARQAITIKP